MNEESLFNKLVDGEAYEFKVKDYTTLILGRYKKGEDKYSSYLYIQRGDNTILQKYSLDRVVLINDLSRTPI